MVNPVWLKTFVTLVEQKHFTRTAEQLNMTQPGVSQHIRKLEAYYSIPLINRFDKSFEITPAGEQVYRFAIEQLTREQYLREQLKEDSPYQGYCRLSSPGALALRLYPQLIQLQKEHPELLIHYEVAPNHRIQSELLNNQIDIGLMTCEPANSSLMATAVGQEGLCLVVPTGKTVSDFDDLISMGLISHPDAAHHATLLLKDNFQAFEHIADLPVKGYINQINMILEPIAAGAGFTVIPASVIEAFPQPALIKRVSLGKPVHETIYQVSKRHRPLANRYRFIMEGMFQ